ncbi:uncharacterized protein LOC127842799 isoform X6 [Dreissena polymorpha]|uniref:uncharacterized protein LOC127842799 isoform X6 n=1 Tax=Dreissena polymorpha TaxID=45954 RepID=UPI00226437EB|nr:uncharacterized protein LOC127842799 isoform X6 [Dreissena polymorpha]
MGQGQTKASKRRETNGEQGPSPKKEAKKSPKKTRSSRSSSTESPSKGKRLPIEEQEESPTQQKRRGSRSRSSPGKASKDYNGDSESAKYVESPPKPKRTFEVDFVEPQKENVPVELDGMDTLNVSEIRNMEYTSQTPNGHGHEHILTPKKTSDLNRPPQATSTPAPNGIVSTGKGGHSSDEDHTDVSDDEAYASEQHLRSTSPSASNVSLKSFSTIHSSSLRTKSCRITAFSGMCLPGRFWHSTNHVQDSSYERKREVNYGKFYNTSYLKTGSSQNYVHRGRTLSEPRVKNNVNQFIRPENFSYSKGTPSFLKNTAKKSGMMTLAQGKPVTKVRRSSSPGPIPEGTGTTPADSETRTGSLKGIRRNLEAVRMSTFPAGKPPPPREIAKIDRDDWPAPPSPAAILPEILRQRRKSRGEEDVDEDEAVFEDPKIKREIEELRKFKDESGIGKVIYNELEVAKKAPLKLLDPWKASRVPNAKYEPKYQTRYLSPMFASPSRIIDRSRRSWDDSDIRGYRTISIVGNFPAPKPGYGLSPRAATLPVSGMYGGPLDLDYRVYDLTLAEGRDHRVSMSSLNTETSKVTSTIFDQPGVSLMTFQKSSWHTESKPPEYPYDRLKISNFDLPKDVDRNMLEIHLPEDEFVDIFGMSSEEFHHMPEWKRNDLKRKKDLY